MCEANNPKLRRHRTPLGQRLLPNYTKGEELCNAISHTVGGALGIVVLLGCLWVSIPKGDAWGIVGGSIYGVSMIALYTVSAVYHFLRAGTAKKVMQIIDHCTIYLLIAGTYTPIVLCGLRPRFPLWGWLLFGLVWSLAALGTVFTAIDLKKYAVFSMICYIGMGWCVVLAVVPMVQALPAVGLLWLLAGGIAYTIGAVLYGLGKKYRYMHFIFHLFVLLGSVLQFVCIIKYIL